MPGSEKWHHGLGSIGLTNAFRKSAANLNVKMSPALRSYLVPPANWPNKRTRIYGCLRRRQRRVHRRTRTGGFIVAGTKQTYGIGRIALWTRRDVNRELKNLKTSSTECGVSRLRTPITHHTELPHAKRSRLQGSGTRSSPESSLQKALWTLQYAESGNVDVAIVALSLCIGSHGTWTLIPDNLHKPIIQSMAVIKGTTNEEAARSFVKYVNDVDGRLIMQRFGFSLPGELTQ